MRRILSTTKWRITEAMDGIEALEAIGREWPDLVLLDLMMPRMGERPLLFLVVCFFCVVFVFISHGIDCSLMFGVRSFLMYDWN